MMRVLASEVWESLQKLADTNISKATSHRWRKKYGDNGFGRATRLKELAKENTELKTILAASRLKNRLLEAVNAKIAQAQT